MNMSDFASAINDNNVSLEEFNDHMISYRYDNMKKQLKFNAWYFFIFYPLNIAALIHTITSKGLSLSMLPSLIILGVCISYIVGSAKIVNKLNDVIIEAL